MSPPTESLSRYGLQSYQAERIAKIGNAKIAPLIDENARLKALYVASTNVKIALLAQENARLREALTDARAALDGHQE